jgi:LacI family transcriptional regulator
MGAESRRFRVALLIETSNRYGRDLLHGVHDWMSACGNWAVRFSEQARLAPLPDWLATWQGDGVIARVDTDAMAAALRVTRWPVVDVSAERARSEFPRVTIDNAAVARLAADHLREKGLAHFAFCGDRRFLWSAQRQRAFVACLRAARRRCEVFAFAGGAPTDDADMARLEAWLLNLPKPVGVFVCYDGRAQQVLEACQRTGLQVPAQVAVLGVDNDEVVCDLCSPPLSSVLPNARQTGFEAARRLHTLMTAPRPARRRVRESLAIEPLRVVARQSTDLVGVEDPALIAAIRHIRSHACDGIAVADVLRVAGLSRTHLERRFKQVLGQTPHALIRSAQLEQVKQLLLETNLPIARVADVTGFQSPSYLSAVFRREQGETPFEFRRKRRRTSAHGVFQL